MITAYIMFVWFAAGQPPRVSLERDRVACMQRLYFESRFDPRVVIVCFPHDGDEA